MKKYILYFCFLILPSLAFSQFNTSIDIIASLDYSSLLNPTMDNEVGKLNYRFGGNFNLKNSPMLASENIFQKKHSL